MTWNYRVIKHDNQYGICEVFYTDDGDMYSDPVTVEGEDLQDLRWTLEAMLEALDKPIYEPEA